MVLGLIGGSSLLASRIFDSFEHHDIETRFGQVRVHLPGGSQVLSSGSGTFTIDCGQQKKVVFVQRHHADPECDYSVPHLINKRAITEALVLLQVSRVVCFASVGTLRNDWGLGTMVVADDFFHFPGSKLSCFDDYRSHFIPQLSPSPFRDDVCEFLRENDVSFTEGTYAQANGPRFETRAEIKFLATVADVIGMTAAEEMTLLLERQLPCVLLCMIDNAANGIELAGSSLDSMDDFKEGVAQNQSTIDVVCTKIVGQFS